MARIRSVHPGLFTDEGFMSLSAEAALFMVGLWCECDDVGRFEWKPLTLKARLRPASPVDASSLLTEIEAAGFIVKYVVSGKAYGEVRNFTKYQRPKFPKTVHPIPVDYPGPTEAVPQPSVTPPPKPPQMEDGGWRMEDGQDSEAVASGAEAPSAEPPSEQELVWGDGVAWLGENTKRSIKALRPLVGRWCSVYGDAHVLGALTECRSQSPPVVEPVAWIEQSLKARNRDGYPGRKTSQPVRNGFIAAGLEDAQRRAGGSG